MSHESINFEVKTNQGSILVFLVNQLHSTGCNFVVYIAIDVFGVRAKHLGFSFLPGGTEMKHQKQEMVFLEHQVMIAAENFNFLFVLHDGDPNTVSDLKKFF